MADHPVTGGDLFVLWHAAHKRLPEAKKVYDKASEIHKNDLPTTDDKSFGRAFPAWLKLIGATKFLMDRSSLSLQFTSDALDAAIEEYQYVDGDNAKGLTDAGKDLEGLVEKDKKGSDGK